MPTDSVLIDIASLYEGGTPAKLGDLPSYLGRVRERTGRGTTVILTGAGPIWLYLSVAHALHGVDRKLLYRAPVPGTTDLVIFDHDPD